MRIMVLNLMRLVEPEFVIDEDRDSVVESIFTVLSAVKYHPNFKIHRACNY